MEQEHLDQAYRHIAELKAHIVRQRVLLKDALDTGQPSEVAESMLHALEGSLRIFEKHRQLILEQLRRPSEGADGANNGKAPANATPGRHGIPRWARGRTILRSPLPMPPPLMLFKSASEGGPGAGGWGPKVGPGARAR